MPRKRALLDNISIEKNEKSDSSVKKRKCSIKKLLPAKTEAEKPITRKKNIKITTQVVAGENSANNSNETSIGNNNTISDFIGISESSVSKTPVESLLKVPKKRATSVLKKPLVHNMSNDVLVESDKSCSVVSSKSTKSKTSKSISPVKVKFVFNEANYNKKLTKLATSNVSRTSKNLRTKECIKSVTSVKNKSTENSINKDEPWMNKVEKSNNVITSKTARNKTSKTMSPTKNKPVSFNGNKDSGLSNVFEIGNGSVPETTSKNKKSKSVTPNKKKFELNGAADEFEKISPSKGTRKSSRSFLNKSLSQNLRETMVNTSATISLHKYEPPCPSEEFDDNTMMLRSSKPPKIKKKWSDKWSGNKSSNSILKLNVDNHTSVSKTDVNNCDNIIQKPKSLNCKTLKTKMMEKLNNDSLPVNISNICGVIENTITDSPETSNILVQFDDNSIISKVNVNNCDNVIKKPKSPNCKKHKTKMIEKLNINDSLSAEISNNCNAVESSKTNFPETQHCDAELIGNVSSAVTSVAENDDFVVYSESNDIDPLNSNCSNLLHLATITTTLDSLPIPASQPRTFTSPPATCIAPPPIPSMSTLLSATSTTLLPTCNSPLEMYSAIPTTSTTQPTYAEVSDILSGNENQSQLHSITHEPTNSSSFLPVSESEISYGISILSEAISRQCNESTNSSAATMSVEQNFNDIKSLKEHNSSTPKLNVVPFTKTKKSNKPRKTSKRFSEILQQSMESKSQPRIEHEIYLLSVRFNVSRDILKKIVIEDSLAVFRENYLSLANPSILTVSPVIEYANSSLNSGDQITKNVNVKYLIEPIREKAAYEKTNLKDMMLELSNTMPAWSLSIVPNPSRYVITHMSVNKCGVPFADKCILFDKYFRASVFINHCLEFKYCKSYTTGTEIINLIKDLNSL